MVVNGHGHRSEFAVITTHDKPNTQSHTPDSTIHKLK